MRRMMKEFMKAMAGGSDSEISSSEEKEREERRIKKMNKRPAVLKAGEGLKTHYLPEETTIVEVEVQNLTRWPCPLRSIQKLDGNIDFEEIAVDEKLRYEDKTTLSLIHI